MELENLFKFSINLKTLWRLEILARSLTHNIFVFSKLNLNYP